MKCMICGSAQRFYFSKNYEGSPYGKIMSGFGDVEYFRCNFCGFVSSLTHQQLNFDQWESLNYLFHKFSNSLSLDAKPSNSPPYADQSIMLALAGMAGLIDTSNMLDYAGGSGILSYLMRDLYSINMPIYDPYIQEIGGNNYLNNNDLGNFPFVFNSAMFEHVLRRSDLDSVNNLVRAEGILGIHTVVCEEIPRDPNWFYLVVRVHTAFHTNKSMGILMEQWGYKSSVYVPRAKSWLLLKEASLEIERKVNRINERVRSEWFFYKSGFVDYCK